MIKVPFMKMPESCDKCDFGRCRYSNPFWDRTETSGKHGYNCQIEYYEKGRYETVREAPYDEHIVPTECPLIDEDESNYKAESEDKDADSNQDNRHSL